MKPFSSLILAATFVAFSIANAGAVTATIAETSPPINITADQGIEWERNASVVHARGNAKAVRGEVTVTADMLSAFYRETATGDSEIWRLEANGDVVIERPGERAYSERAVYETDTEMVVLTGGTPNRLVGEDGEMTAEERIEYWTEDQKLVAHGNAMARDETSELRAAVITAYLEENEEGDLVLDHADAAGDLLLTTETDVVRGDEGTYDAKRRVATVNGSVHITRGNNRLSGCRGEVDFNTGVNRLLPCDGQARSNTRVHGLIKPKAESPPQQ